MTTDSRPTALAIIEPQTMEELVRFAEAAADSKLYGFSPSQALMICMRGRDLGFTYSQALAAFDMIKGKPAMKADAMAAACLRRTDICEYFRLVELTPTRAVWKTKRIDDENVIISEFTIEEATQARLAGKGGQSEDMYTKWPKRMLSARAKSFLARDVYPDVLLGILSEDEAREMPEGPSHVAVTVVQTTPNAPTTDVTPPKAPTPKAAVPYAGADMIAKLKVALDGASTLARIDTIFGSFDKRRSTLTAEDDDAAVAMFANARARIEDAAQTQDAAQ